LVAYLFAELGTNTTDRQARTGGLTGTALLGVVWLSTHGGCATRSVVARTNERKCRRRCGWANDDVKAVGERSVRWKVYCSKLTLVQAAGSVRILTTTVGTPLRLGLRCDATPRVFFAGPRISTTRGPKHNALCVGYSRR
jgi:hypothetical protein